MITSLTVTQCTCNQTQLSSIVFSMWINPGSSTVYMDTVFLVKCSTAASVIFPLGIFLVIQDTMGKIIPLLDCFSPAILCISQWIFLPLGSMPVCLPTQTLQWTVCSRLKLSQFETTDKTFSLLSSVAVVLCLSLTHKHRGGQSLL